RSCVNVGGWVSGGTVGEHDAAAVWRPGWLPGESPHVGDLVDVAAVGVHGVHLKYPGAVAVEDDFTPVRRPSGPVRLVLHRRVRELIAVTAVRIDASDLGAATAVVDKRDLPVMTRKGGTRLPSTDGRYHEHDC